MRTKYENALARLLMSESTPKLGLLRMRALLEELKNPERDFAAIHVAGTNGKGSTCAFLASLLQSTGKKVGLYTSPHLLCARERIQIDRQLVAEDLFCAAEKVVFEAAQKIGEQPSFFERMTAMAFWIFAQEKVDIAVIEVGLGGRLDATNAISPRVCVITRIDLDHTEFLGDTLKKIAHEKAGIIKPHTPVVTGFQHEGVAQVLHKTAEQLKAPFLEVCESYQAETGLRGTHQNANAALAIAATRLAGLTISPDQISAALLATQWPARLELVSQTPHVLIDGAHNPAGVKALVATLQNDPALNANPLILIIGTTLGHDIELMRAELAPLKSRITQIITTKSRSPRAMCSTSLASILGAIAPSIFTETVSNALQMACSRAEEKTLIVALGSLYVAGEVRGLLSFQMPIDPELPVF